VHWFTLIADHLDAQGKEGGTATSDISKSSVIWGCPTYPKTSSDSKPGYGMNGYAWLSSSTTGDWGSNNFFDSPGTARHIIQSKVKYSAGRSLYLESDDWGLGWSPNGTSSTGNNVPGTNGNPSRHRNVVNAVFYDGHVQLIPARAATGLPEAINLPWSTVKYPDRFGG